MTPKQFKTAKEFDEAIQTARHRIVSIDKILSGNNIDCIISYTPTRGNGEFPRSLYRTEISIQHQDDIRAMLEKQRIIEEGNIAHLQKLLDEL
jgi:hypothetical protein